ncbi:hypothetical protein PN836_011635 [Ningiella sp. W23]|uniref:hypothetical protein n=1 Tax=Ningiella sp. W23 TaxID=3023715 RepID=UPI003756BC31
MMTIVRFGKFTAGDVFPTEAEFRKKIGRSGFYKTFSSSNKYLDEIYTCLNRAKFMPNDMGAMRRLRKACARWVNKKGQKSSNTSNREKQIVELGLKASDHYYMLVNRMYLDKGRQARLEERAERGKISDTIKMNMAGLPAGRSLGSNYKMERFTTNHISHHVLTERDWNTYVTTHKSRLGFEDWAEMIALPDREDDVATLHYTYSNGTAEQIRGSGVEYLNDEQREDYRIVSQGGRLFYAVNRIDSDFPTPVNTSGMRGTTGTDFGIYVIDLQMNIYINKPQSSQFHHSSFLGGAPVFAAGEMAIHNGLLRGINNKTGHYEASRNELHETLKLLKRMHVNFHNAVTQDRSMVRTKWFKVNDVLRADCNFEADILASKPDNGVPQF